MLFSMPTKSHSKTPLIMRRANKNNQLDCRQILLRHTFIGIWEHLKSTVNQFSHSELCNLHIVSGPVSKLIQFTIQDMWYRPTTVLFVFRTRVQLSFKQINQEAGGSVLSIKSTKSVKRNARCSSFVQKLFNVCDLCTKAPIGRDMFFCWFTLSDCLLSASNRLPSSLFAFFLISDHDATA